MAKRLKTTDKEYIKSLKVLKRKGLYSGDLRKAPTDYSKRLARKYSDVVQGHATVFAIPQQATKKTKGAVAAKMEAKSIAEAYSEQVRSKGRHLIVKTVSNTDKVTYSKKNHEAAIVRKLGKEGIERIPLKSDMTLEYAQDGTVDLKIRDLRSGENYAVPFVGEKGVRYVHFGSKADLQAALNKYKTTWEAAVHNVTIATVGEFKAKPKRKRKPRK